MLCNCFAGVDPVDEVIACCIRFVHWFTLDCTEEKDADDDEDDMLLMWPGGANGGCSRPLLLMWS